MCLSIHSEKSFKYYLKNQTAVKVNEKGTSATIPIVFVYFIVIVKPQQTVLKCFNTLYCLFLH